MPGPEAMRRMDRWLGVPVCALLSGMRRAARTWRRTRAQEQAVRRVLFVQLAESGSMVLADPAMRELTARSGAQAYCLTFAHNRDSLAIAGTVAPERVFVMRTGSLRVLVTDAWRFLRDVRRERIDALIDLELFSRLTAALCVLTGVRRRAGFHRFGGVGLYRGDLYTHPLAFNPQLHMAQNYLMLVEALFAEDVPPAPRVPAAMLVPSVCRRELGADELAVVRERLGRLRGGPIGDERLVLVNANASAMLPQRRWPQAHFVALVRATLARYADVRVLLIGAEDDRATTAAIADEVGDERCADIAGHFALGELPALFALGAALVSNDSGPAHFAAVTALPVIALFGPETPVLFRPLGNATVISAGLACSPCVNAGNQRRTRCTDNQCMRRIAVAEVFGALCRVLDARPLRLAPRDALAEVGA
ncbi:glycosyltransferase family 9 protein [Aromatoleum toluclasticum]|uniref:glycosyltransferase family 9 protein n=1 Tax=Aromatoleum toluclasticum TaxID=92003 RepID=UPI001D18BF2C|nr:glycosyltransferase family 9 protein [Aromatoleum toluclasticum]MCC4114255.1 glycosyltransferase family 9 protein [Aromatoleum toluclasticum]